MIRAPHAHVRDDEYHTICHHGMIAQVFGCVSLSKLTLVVDCQSDIDRLIDGESLGRIDFLVEQKNCATRFLFLAAGDSSMREKAKEHNRR